MTLDFLQRNLSAKYQLLPIIYLLYMQITEYQYFKI